MKSSIQTQQETEHETAVAYGEYQQHPLKHKSYESYEGKQKELDASIPFSCSIDKFSESKQHPLPIQDDAATFMHSRRLLSSLGFLRPNAASGVPRFVDILKNNAAVNQCLAELDEITSLDRISVSILYQNDCESQLSDLDMLSSPKSVESNHSQSFEYFLTSMANRVSIKTHVGYRANLTDYRLVH
eukprot:TRINITY_DN2488_c0_g1_i1.p1 TRINITY_DN2488_c0_g1~~TRINITY_DN2488_c0_g1_i1.p1  ORF type:complete len:187 (-),score=62.68 TRINITY_DN2488_c0_g1_i1:339-899(-)